MQNEIILRISAANKGYFVVVKLFKFRLLLIVNDKLKFELSTSDPSIQLRNVVGDVGRQRDIINLNKDIHVESRSGDGGHQEQSWKKVKIGKGKGK